MDSRSRLWLMNTEPLPSHWAEFTSSHNHLFFPTFIRHLCIYLLLSPSFCSSCFSPPVDISVFSSTYFFFTASALYDALILNHACLLSLFIFFLVFIPRALNLCTFAACGTRGTTRSRGTSSTRRTSTR